MLAIQFLGVTSAVGYVWFAFAGPPSPPPWCSPSDTRNRCSSPSSAPPSSPS
ncbi:hypothetical protein [Tessaracoccus coleopterorum]|uniref:hypothetical protein n=1 Tax=Tessaracoccus coleopterorum TaxID=2714950 RepID=UPI0018D3CA49